MIETESIEDKKVNGSRGYLKISGSGLQNEEVKRLR